MGEVKTCPVCSEKFNAIGYKHKYCCPHCKQVDKNRKSIDNWVNAKPRVTTKWGEGFRLFDIGNGIFKNSQDEQIYKIRKGRKNDQ